MAVKYLAEKDITIATTAMPDNHIETLIKFGSSTTTFNNINGDILC